MPLPAHITIDTVNQFGPIEVFLDGVPVKYACEAHTSEGWVVAYKQDEQGEPIVEGEEFAMQKLFGVVTAEGVGG